MAVSKKRRTFAPASCPFGTKLFFTMDSTTLFPNIFDRAFLLLGPDVMDVISTRRAIVFGTGGVGSWCVEGLVRSGIHHITIVDSDCVAPSNVNRQLMATTRTIGQPKVEALRQRLLDINPLAEVTAIEGVYNAENAADYRLEDYDIIVDAIDSLQEKADLIRHATRTKAIFVSAMGAARKMDPTKLQVAEFWNVKGCPLARALREKFKRQKSFPARKFKCVFSDEVLPNRGALAETPDGPPAGIVDTWAAKKAVTNGSMVHITAIAGFMLAGIILNDLYHKTLSASE